jgi:hypothetical protein
MRTNKISLFKELYFWIYFYSTITIGKKNKFQDLRFGASVFFSGLRMANFASVWVFIKWILIQIGFKFDPSSHNNLFSVCLFGLMIFDWIYFKKKNNSITAICEQFSKKRRTIGQIKFWIYVGLTILLFGYVDRLQNSMCC